MFLPQPQNCIIHISKKKSIQFLFFKENLTLSMTLSMNCYGLFPWHILTYIKKKKLYRLQGHFITTQKLTMKLLMWSLIIKASIIIMTIICMVLQNLRSAFISLTCWVSGEARIVMKNLAQRGELAHASARACHSQRMLQVWLGLEPPTSPPPTLSSPLQL